MRTSTPRAGDRRARASIIRAVLGAYAAAILLIAVFPIPVDRGISPLLHRMLQHIPWLKYHHVEFGANIALFIPFGLLLALIVSRRHVVVPATLVAAVAIESIQSVALKERTASVLDILANVTGACIGLLLVEVAEWFSRRRPARD